MGCCIYKEENKLNVIFSPTHRMNRVENYFMQNDKNQLPSNLNASLKSHNYNNENSLYENVLTINNVNKEELSPSKVKHTARFLFKEYNDDTRVDLDEVRDIFKVDAGLSKLSFHSEPIFKTDKCINKDYSNKSINISVLEEEICQINKRNGSFKLNKYVHIFSDISNSISNNTTKKPNYSFIDNDGDITNLKKHDYSFTNVSHNTTKMNISSNQIYQNIFLDDINS